MADKTESEFLISEQPYYKKNVLKWASYDLGNTIFSMAVVSLTLSPLIYIMYFEQGFSADDSIIKGTYAVSLVLLIGNMIMAFVSPFLGAYSDQLQQRKNLLIKISLLCIAFMASLFVSSIDNINIWLILILFLFSNLFYQAGLVVYDAMLPFITDADSVGKIGGLGVALGYFGSFIAIGIGFALKPMYGDYFIDTDPVNFTKGYIPYLYPIAAVLFLLFALPMLTVKEKPRTLPQRNSDQLRKDVTDNVVQTAKEVMKYKDMLFFLIGWLIFVDAANTVILFMAPMVGIGLEFGDATTIQIVLGIGIASAVLLTYFVGIFVDKHGPKKGMMLITFLWIFSLLLGIMTNLEINGTRTPEWLVYVFPIFVGPALGGSWVVQRQFITELSPTAKVGNYFGFANIFGRISAAFGPFLWAFSVAILHKNVGLNINMATRMAMFMLIALMIIGFAIIMLKVRDPHKAFLAGGRSNGKGEWINSDGEIVPLK